MTSTQESSLNSRILMKPSLRVALPRLLAFVLVCLLVWMIVLAIPASDAAAQLRFRESAALFLIPLIPLLGAVVLARSVIRCLDSSLEVTPHHVRYVSGRCSLKKKTVEFAYEDILEVEVDQNVVDRLLNLGTISFGTAMRSQPEAVISGLSDPQGKAGIIARRVDNARLTMNHAKGRSI